MRAFLRGHRGIFAACFIAVSLVVYTSMSLFIPKTVIPETRTLRNLDEIAQKQIETGANAALSAWVFYWTTPGADKSPDGDEDFPEYYGGWYTAGDGRLIMLLTEDSPEIRAEICGICGTDEISFEPCEFSWDTLNALAETLMEINREREASGRPIVIGNIDNSRNCLHLFFRDYYFLEVWGELRARLFLTELKEHFENFDPGMVVCHGYVSEEQIAYSHLPDHYFVPFP